MWACLWWESTSNHVMVIQEVSAQIKNLRRPTANCAKFRLWPIFHLETNCCFQTSLDSGNPLRAWQHEKILNCLPADVKARETTCDDSHGGVSIRTFSCEATWTISPERHLRSHRVVSAELELCGGISPHRCACWGKLHRGSRSSPSPGAKGNNIDQHLLNTHSGLKGRSCSADIESLVPLDNDCWLGWFNSNTLIVINFPFLLQIFLFVDKTPRL